MKYITIFLALTFSVMFSSSSYAEWTWVGEGAGPINSGDNYYVDFDRIRKHDGYVYFWTMTDYLEPSVGKFWSDIGYHQGDCRLFRLKALSSASHRQPMGKDSSAYPIPLPEYLTKWEHPEPNSVIDVYLKSVCNR